MRKVKEKKKKFCNEKRVKKRKKEEKEKICKTEVVEMFTKEKKKQKGERERERQYFGVEMTTNLEVQRSENCKAGVPKHFVKREHEKKQKKGSGNKTEEKKRTWLFLL